jgi:hypothetical protein
MDDDFDMPAGDDMMMGEDGMGDFGGAEGPVMKVGEEKEIGKQGLKKKLLKEGEGWDTPEVGDEVEGISPHHYFASVLVTPLKSQMRRATA